MKNIIEKLNESICPSTNYTQKTSPYLGLFKETVKYSKSDWNEWVKLMEKEQWGKDILIGNYESAPDLTVIYRADHKNHIMDHIGSYDNKKEILYCDDIHLFGNEK